MTPIESLIGTGTKLWIDSVSPDLTVRERAWGATGATSNPVIVSDLIDGGVVNAEMERMIQQGQSDHDLAWCLTDLLVQKAQELFLPVWEQTRGNDGYVSFELDPLLEDPTAGLSIESRVAQYVELGKKWSKGHRNRLIKIPATPAGFVAMEQLVALGINLNVTLIFTVNQYQQARDAIWRGASKLGNLDNFKCVYSVFISRIDAYTAKHVAELSPAAQGMVGIVIAKRMCAENDSFWAARPTRLRQEMVLASMGTKRPEDKAWKYVDALAGGDIMTNPPATNEAVSKSGVAFTRNIGSLPADAVLQEIDRQVDLQKLETFLMAEGIAKFVEPQKHLLATIAAKRAAGK